MLKAYHWLHELIYRIRGDNTLASCSGITPSGGARVIRCSARDIMGSASQIQALYPLLNYVLSPMDFLFLFQNVKPIRGDLLKRPLDIDLLSCL